jgi:diguanylate cyclase (GGDEF)-like protein
MMSDRVEMLEATLDLIEEGVVVLDEQSKVLFWNKAATALTGYQAEDVMWRSCPENLYHIDEEHRDELGASAEARRRSLVVRSAGGYCGAIAGYSGHTPMTEMVPVKEDENMVARQPPILVSISHKLGHSVPGMFRKAVLRNAQEALIGTALLFFPVEEVDALPRGETSEDVGIESGQAEMEDRLDAAYHHWTSNHMPLGLLWITVDQSQSLRRTHGRDACESMLRVMEQTLMRQMNPLEILGRWGDDEYLVLAHERTAELLMEHARRLAGQARTADFRWWGDRVGLSVSIGVSFAFEGDTLPMLLNRARQAMQASVYAGGNRVNEARGA